MFLAGDHLSADPAERMVCALLNGPAAEDDERQAILLLDHVAGPPAPPNRPSSSKTAPTVAVVPATERPAP